MCHVAGWLLDKTSNPPHGDVRTPLLNFRIRYGRFAIRYYLGRIRAEGGRPGLFRSVCGHFRAVSTNKKRSFCGLVRAVPTNKNGGGAALQSAQVFKKWAARAMKAYPDLTVSTCHAYDIKFAYRRAFLSPALPLLLVVLNITRV